MWTDKSDSVVHFFVTHVAMETGNITGVRPAFEISHLSGSVIVAPAFQLSNDGETWDDANTCTLIANVTARTTEGVTYHASMEQPTLNKRFVRWGLQIKNAASGTTLEMILGSLRLEFKRG